MFESLSALPSDPLLNLIDAFRKDPNPQKIDLGVGVYKNDLGQTPVLEAVKRAEKHLLETESSKSYVGAMGNLGFAEELAKLCLGEDHPLRTDGRLVMMQTPGGCGALRVAAEFVLRAKPKATIWISDPTWANHKPLLSNAGLSLKTYPYYNFSEHSIRFDEMMASLSNLGSEDIVLLHGACHNPCGADLSERQWQQLAELAAERGFVPFIDMAYQGFGDGLAEDAQGLRIVAAKVEELLLAVSCSKNFGMYRERVGAVGVVSRNSRTSDIAESHLVNIVRGIYSMPPSHGASVVELILSEPELSKVWHRELADMRKRIKSMRESLVKQLADLGTERDFTFIRHEKGMFSFLGISEPQVARLAEEFSIYMASSSRMCMAGLNRSNITYFCDSLVRVLAV